jgi:membrane peptidoglycan carboxypeptidase
VSEQTASLVNKMLQAVVIDGTGTAAAIPGYAVAGKTGTARKPPYELNQHVASFVGFAPANAPRLAISVVIDEPQTKIYGGEVAAPVFAGIMQNALRVMQVPPDLAVAGPPPAYQADSKATAITTTTSAPATAPTTAAAVPATGAAPSPGPGAAGATGPAPTPSTGPATRARAGPAGTLTVAASPSG